MPQEKHDSDEVRIDKWLWAVRVYKTRSLATEAIRNGRVKVGGQVVKPSREVHLNDQIDIHLGVYHKTVKVVALLHNRVGAALVPNFLEDLTPEEEYAKLKIQQEMKPEFRPRGIGRPTKKHRRLIDRLKKTKDFD
ncbi:MAG TPA: RNA-binding S4 domain-containing protein [Bacteroidales bacterium]|nr:RNA-binding S4 domain-containing protein [Bacteroidales bacterium]HOX79058.1 RNA-binding S4 domain-containing protein [Bacteroidales bacterium]HPI87400.1 RNA-binding S4 domain-containing protein [Bacteroidales bacterium]HPM91996.1 RNA-binding S4 domain-containing protein [Bacteroidales bacterium]